ncbi:protein ABHD15 [Salarias fasciatus]|uniref:protein ABHD15 n=1 Tax=Salarias fasciatus TaxID=181472 RepID=UPI001176D3E8|nr:protein ABHD15-like [Salarias fasciatus]
MALFLSDFLLLLLPCLLLALLSAALRWPRTRRWTDRALKAAGRRLWTVVCWTLKLPLCDDAEAGSPGAPAGSGQTPDGPRLVCKPTALARYLLRHCGCLAGPGPRGDPHLQTACSQLWEQRERALRFTRDHLLLRDGGVVALDWAVGTRAGEAAERRRKEHHAGGKALGCFTAAPPVLLLIPQCWGGMTPHLRALCQLAMRQGFYVVVFHPRGTAGCPLATARLTEFGDPADLEQAVSYIRSRLPSSTLVAVSEGSGSGVLLSYLGESGSSTQLTAAAAISPVLLGQRWFEADMPPLYRWGALFQRKRPLRRYASSFRGVLDVDRALRCASLRDLEETLFCSSSSSSPPPCSRPPSRGRGPPVAWALGERAFPAEDWGGYWERNEPLRDADDVAAPLLCICSRDDPLLPPPSSLPLRLFQSSPFFLLLLTDRGGHCGFALQGAGPGGEEEQPGEAVWSHNVVLEYFKVVADFLKVGEREGSGWGGPQEENIQALLRSRSMNPAPLRKRRPPIMRRPRPPAAPFEDAEETFTWRRSYTR